MAKVPDLQKVVAECLSRLPDGPSSWQPFDGYPNSLALCVIDSLFSMGVRYTNVENVTSRYRKFRIDEGCTPDSDGLSDLLGVFDRVGGIEAFTKQIGTSQRVATRPIVQPLKSEVVHEAASTLLALRIDSAADFLAADPDALELDTPMDTEPTTEHGCQLKAAWLALPGQARGTSWRYLRMLVGLRDVKPDRMVRRFVARALGFGDGAEDHVSEGYAVSLIRQVARRFGVDERALDHEIWRFEATARSI